MLYSISIMTRLHFRQTVSGWQEIYIGENKEKKGGVVIIAQLQSSLNLSRQDLKEDV